MPLFREWVNRVLGTFGPKRSDLDLEEELRLYVQMATEDARRTEGSAQHATRAAAIRFGGVAAWLSPAKFSGNTAAFPGPIRTGS